MPTFLFNEIIFGPVRSRRLGISLGINLLPLDRKWCNFDCLYCECGLNTGMNVSKEDLPSAKLVREALRKKIEAMKKEAALPDVITFAGNGEPTIHPAFPEIIDNTIAIRNELCPDARIAVLSNATTIHKPDIKNALKRVDQNILKLDTAIDSTFRMINRPGSTRNIKAYIEALAGNGSKMIIQTLFLKGEYEGRTFDNTSQEEIEALIQAYKLISPEYVMIYSFARDTPVSTLEKCEPETLERIAAIIRREGISCEVSS